MTLTQLIIVFAFMGGIIGLGLLARWIAGGKGKAP